jgi:glycine/D-amino acid oxidase-like deaminating enzyme
MACQNESGQITIGDSHEYSLTHDPFDRAHINTLIMDYLKQFAKCKDWHIAETWNGIYPMLTNGDTDLFYSPESRVYIVNGLGGAGMTLSFGLAEEIVNFI